MFNVHVPKSVDYTHVVQLCEMRTGPISVTHEFVEVSMLFVVFRLRSGIEHVSTTDCTVVSST